MHGTSKPVVQGGGESLESQVPSFRTRKATPNAIVNVPPTNASVKPDIVKSCFKNDTEKVK